MTLLTTIAYHNWLAQLIIVTVIYFLTYKMKSKSYSRLNSSGNINSGSLVPMAMLSVIACALFLSLFFLTELILF